jgi:hypothetical protein
VRGDWKEQVRRCETSEFRLETDYRSRADSVGSNLLRRATTFLVGSSIECTVANFGEEIHMWDPLAQWLGELSLS